MVKNKNDARYQKTEDAILSTLLKFLRQRPHTLCLSPSKLAHLSGISTSTFYRHYKNIDDVLTSRERQILKKYRQLLHRLKAEDLTLKQIFRHTLFFIMRHHYIFSLSISHYHCRLLEAMFFDLRPIVRAKCHLPKGQQIILDIYFSELRGLLEKWADHAFSATELDDILDSMIYLAQTARTRLAPISKN